MKPASYRTVLIFCLCSCCLWSPAQFSSGYRILHIESAKPVQVHVYEHRVDPASKEPVPVLYFPYAQDRNEWEELLQQIRANQMIFPAIIVALRSDDSAQQVVAFAARQDANKPIKAAAVPTFQLAAFILDELTPALKKIYPRAATCILAGDGNGPAISEILEAGIPGFDGYLCLQPFVHFRHRNERRLALQFFSRYAYYKNVDLQKLTDEERAWPDPVLLKMGLERPIYLKE